MLSEIM